MPYVGNINTTFTTLTSSDANITDDLTVTDDASVGGDLTISDKIIHSGDTDTVIRFPAADTVAIETGGSERMRINSSGNVAIGNTDPDAYGSLIDNLVIGTTSGNNGMTIASGTDSGGRICFADNTTSPQRGMIEYSHGDDSMIINANGATRITIGSGGDIDVETGDIFFSTAGKGVVLGATSNTDANTLDDYEEGTWTPRITASTAGVATPTADNGGTYVKVGNMVTLNFGIFWDAVTTTMNGSRRISGLPFTSANITGNYAGSFMGPHYSGMLQADHLNYMALPPNVNYIEVLSINSDGTNNASGHNYDHTGMSMPSAGNHTSLTLVYRAA